MAYNAPLDYSSTPPPPPPKPSTSSSRQHTPLTSGPPPPPPPPPQGTYPPSGAYQPTPPPLPPQEPSSHHPGHPAGSPLTQHQPPQPPSVPPPSPSWLPPALNDKPTSDLTAVLSDPALQHALIHAPSQRPPAIPASAASLSALLHANVALASSLAALESHIAQSRARTQARMLSLRGLERQWRAKQAEQDAALRDFSPPALYQRLSAAAGEQEALCRAVEESFLEGGGEGEGEWGAEGGGRASEREVAEFVRRLREGRKVAWLRRERKERWDEGRVAGWR